MRPSIGFWTLFALVMVALMGVSFAPSFYLKPFVHVTTLSGSAGLPPYLVLHGTVLTTWFLLFLVQTLLVGAHRTDLHRRLGAFGVALGLAVVVTSALTTVRAVPRFTVAGVDPGIITIVVIGDGLALLQFVSFIACGVLLRKRPAAHKRLMLFGALAIIGPGVFGGGRPITQLQPFVPFPLALAFVILTLGAVVAYDVVTTRRVHPATFWAGVVNVLTVVMFGVLLSSGAARAVVTRLQ